MNTQPVSLNEKRPLKFSIGAIFLLIYTVLSAILTLVSIGENIKFLIQYTDLLTFSNVALYLISIISNIIILMSHCLLAILAIQLLCRQSNSSLCALSVTSLILYGIAESIAVLSFLFYIGTSLFETSFYYQLITLREFFSYAVSFLHLIALLCFTIMIFSFVAKKRPAKLLLTIMCVALVLMLCSRPIVATINTYFNYCVGYLGPGSLFSSYFSVFSVLSNFDLGYFVSIFFRDYFLSFLLNDFVNLMLSAGLILCGIWLMNPYRSCDNQEPTEEAPTVEPTVEEPVVETPPRKNLSLSKPIVNEPVTEAPTVFEALEKYKELFDKGVITKEEFDAKKKQLMGL